MGFQQSPEIFQRGKSVEFREIEPRLVAVSKTKPLSDIEEAYAAGHRHFGENYVAELEGKSKNPTTLRTMKDIKWHFIGNLQTNKVNKVTSVPNLWMIETVHSEKIASALEKSWKKTGQDPLNIMLQVNTSGEESKSGCAPDVVVTLMKHVTEKCPHLHVKGLMTIGAFDHDLTKGPNPDFQCLLQCRQRVCEELSLEPHTLELSMGMSNDFEHAIELGSTNVRVGSTIFGARDTKPPKTETSSEQSTSTNQGSSQDAATNESTSQDHSHASNETEISSRVHNLAI